MPAPEALTSDTAAAPLAPLLFLLPVTLSGTLSKLQHLRPCRCFIGPRVSQSSLLTETIPETKDVTQTQDFSRDVEVIPRRTPTADPRPYLRLVDPAAVTLPLHSTPMDEASGVQVSLGTQCVSPDFGNLAYPAGQTLPTQAAGSLQ